MSIGCLKICHNGVSQPISGSHFPRYQSVTHNCTWIVSCIGWHINIGKWCKEDSESGYKLIQIIQCLKKKKKENIFLLLSLYFFHRAVFWKRFSFCDSLGFMCLIRRWWVVIWPKRLPLRVLLSCEYWFLTSVCFVNSQRVCDIFCCDLGGSCPWIFLPHSY